MKTKLKFLPSLAAIMLAFALMLAAPLGCGGETKTPDATPPAETVNPPSGSDDTAPPEEVNPPAEITDPPAPPELVENDPADRDFAPLDTAEKQENAYEYKRFFLPAKDGAGQGYVGDAMPFYEDGTYYVYYLKDGGDSVRHSVYLTSTTDFVTWRETQNAVLSAGGESAQDSWIGTGSVVKVKTKYYFFYTGHNSSDGREFNETIMVAEGTSPAAFTKKANWQITPPQSLGQKQDFRDPQAYYDAATDVITLTITASRGGVARIVKYTLKGDLTNAAYGGIIFTNPADDTVDCYNLECSDTFKLGNKWYMTFSAQDDTLWYTSAATQYGPYTATPKRLDGKIFYAPKHVSNGTDTYMVGWARRSETPSSLTEVGAWAGNLLVQKAVSDGNGGICLAPVDAYINGAATGRTLLCDANKTVQPYYDDVAAFACRERYVVTGEFTFTGAGDFGFAFDFDGNKNNRKLIAFSPAKQTIRLTFNNGKTDITEIRAPLGENKKYSFTYIQEGSLGVMYLNGYAALTVRVYGASGKAVSLYAKNCTVKYENLKQFT